jgi:hypothetical protein
MTPYAEYLLARPKKPALTPTQAARPERRYRRPMMDEQGLSKQVSRACDRFFRRRRMATPRC